MGLRSLILLAFGLAIAGGPPGLVLVLNILGFPGVSWDDVAGVDMEFHDSDDELTRARLGSVRVPPHWQPGIDPRKPF